MPLTDAEAPGPESLYCPWGSNAHSELRRLCLCSWHWLFSLGWGYETEGWLLPTHPLRGVFGARGEGPPDISSYPRSHPCTWCSCFEGGEEGCEWQLLLLKRDANQMLSGLADWLKTVNTKDEIYRVKKGILTGLICWTKSLWSHCFLSQKEMPV